MYHRMNAEKEERDKEFFKQKRADEEAEKLKKLNSMSEEDKEALLREEEAKKEHEAAKSRAAIKTRAAYGSGAAKNIGGGRGGRGGGVGRGGGGGGRGGRSDIDTKEVRSPIVASETSTTYDQGNDTKMQSTRTATASLEKRLEAIEAELNMLPPGTPGKSLREKCYLSFIDFVNPKFRAYNRPLLLALLVFVLTLLLTIWLQAYFKADCSYKTVVSFPQFVGKHYEHYQYIQNMVDAQDESSIEIRLCINHEVQVFAASSFRTTDFYEWEWWGDGGTMVTWAQNCLPPRWFMLGLWPTCTGANDCDSGTNKCIDPDDLTAEGVCLQI